MNRDWNAMNILRVVGGLVSLAVAAVLGIQLLLVAQPVIWPTIRDLLGQEQTTFSVVQIAGLSLSGWQILAFAAAVALVAIGFGAIGLYALFHSRHTD